MEEYLVVKVFTCLLVPLVFLLGFLKGKSRTIFGYMMIGMTIGIIASQFNTMILSAVPDKSYVVANLTPICEEVLKALPVLFFTFAVSSKQDDIIPIAGAVGIGFAVFENITVMLQAENIGLFWVFSRGIGAGLMHVICTTTVGFGMSSVRYKKAIFLSGTFSILALACIYHSIFNMLVDTEELKYIGLFLPLITYFPLLLLVHKYPKKLMTLFYVH